MRDAHHCPYLMQLLSLSFPRGPPSPCVGDWLLITLGPGRLPGPHPLPWQGDVAEALMLPTPLLEAK